MSLNDRIRKLENAAAQDPGGPCPECGYPDREKMRFGVVFDGDPGVADLPENCPTCGEQILCKLSLDDAGDGLTDGLEDPK